MANGAGSIVLDKSAKSKRYIGFVYVDGRRRKVSGPTKKACQEKIDALIADPTPRTLTVADLVAEWSEGLADGKVDDRKVAPTTAEIYEWCCSLIVEQLGTVRLSSLTTKQVETMLKALATRPVKPLGASSLKKVRSTMRQILTFGQHRNLVRDNVAMAARRQWDTAEPTQTALRPDEARALLEALRGERNGALFGLSLRLGLRPGEAAGLHWEDFDGSTLNVTRGRRVARNKVEMSDDLKTKAAKRNITLPADVAEWLKAHRKAQAAERLAADAWADERLMFANEAGALIDPSKGRKRLADICKAAGVPVVRPNELRHSCASLLVDMDVSIQRVADLLGHTTTKMLEAHYKHRVRDSIDVAALNDWTETS